MFVLKIVIFSSALLNVGFAKASCDPNQIIEFRCLESTCRQQLESKLTKGFHYLTKTNCVIFGYNKDGFFIKNNEGKFFISKKNEVKALNHLNDYVINVTIHKTNFEVCDLRNQKDEKNHNDLKIVQINTNIDNLDVNNDVNFNELDETDININESEFIHSSENVSYEDNNDSLEIKIEDELVDTFVQSPSNMDKNKINSDSVELEKVKQNNTTIPQKLENDSLTECHLGSCSKDISKHNENIFTSKTDNSYQQISKRNKADSLTEKSINTNVISSNLNVDDLKDDNIDIKKFNIENHDQQNNEQIAITKQRANLEKTDNLMEESFNNTARQNSNTENLQNNNDIENLNTKNSNQQRSDQFPNIIKTDSPSKELINNAISPNSNTVDLKDDNNDTKKFNIESYDQQNNKEIAITKHHTKLEKTDNVTEDSFNNITLQNSSTENLQSSDTENLNTESSNQQRSDQFPNTIETDNLSKESINNLVPPNPNTVELQDNNNIEHFTKTQLQKNTKSGSLPEMTEADNQQLDNSKKIKVDFPIESNYHKRPEFHNSHKEKVIANDESTTNNDSMDSNITHSSSLENINNNTDIVSSANYPTVDIEVDKTVKNKNSIDQCTSESECEQSIDSITKHNYESISHQHKPENNVLPYKNNHVFMPGPKSKEFEPKSFVSSFGHPDTCSGVNCLKFKRNTEKITKPLNSVTNPDSDTTLHPINTNFEKQNVIEEITEKSNEEFSFLDYFPNVLSFPIINSIDCLWNIFEKYSDEFNVVNSHQTDNNQEMLGYAKHINHPKLYFIVMAIVTLLFSLIYYKYQKETYENCLLTLLATKEQTLLIVEKELSLLKEHNSENTSSTTERNLEIETLNEHLTKSEDIIASQALRIEKLEQEVEELTENGLEMHTLLSSTLESNTKNIDKLNISKAKLADLEKLVEALTQKNFDKTTELEKKNDVLKSLRTNVDELTNKNISLMEDNANISLQLEQIITKNTLKQSKLLGEINNLKFELDKQSNAFIAAENEVLLSKSALQEIMSQKFNPAEANTFSSSLKLSVELKSIKQICEGYKQKLDEALIANQKHLDYIDDLKNDILNLEDNISKLEKKKEESVNKLNILTTFFKEQEKEYLKQINEKASLCDNKEWESNDLHERVKSLNQEISNYKSEIYLLKKEITDQEASFKIQISASDKKASDYWISFRQAERKLKEMELETAQLRNKLTMVDKKLENGTKSVDSSKDFEDELLDIPLPTVSPDFTLLDFEPPPPILTNERLPPLGALGQAPSPPAPLSRRHNRSLSPSSPPPSQRSSIFRPLPQRYAYMNRQNSLGHSVESLDK